jgi:hypothetical protein
MPPLAIAGLALASMHCCPGCNKHLLLAAGDMNEQAFMHKQQPWSCNRERGFPAQLNNGADAPLPQHCTAVYPHSRAIAITCTCGCWRPQRASKCTHHGQTSVIERIMGLLCCCAPSSVTHHTSTRLTMAMHAQQAALPLRAACTVSLAGVSAADAVSADTQVSRVPGPLALQGYCCRWSVRHCSFSRHAETRSTQQPSHEVSTF